MTSPVFSYPQPTDAELAAQQRPHPADTSTAFRATGGSAVGRASRGSAVGRASGGGSAAGRAPITPGGTPSSSAAPIPEQTPVHDRPRRSALIVTVIAASIPLLALGIFMLLKFAMAPLLG